MNKKIITAGLLGMFLLTILSTMPTIGIHTQMMQQKMQTQGLEDWWLMSRHDAAQTGRSTSEAPDTNNLKWSRKINDNANINFDPLVYNDNIYICSIEEISEYESCSKIYCINSDDGAEEWSKKITDNSYMTCIPGAGINNNKIYVSSNRLSLFPYNLNGWLKCMNPENGYVNWATKFNGRVISPPVFFDDKMYIKAEDILWGMNNARIYCIDENGDDLWSFEITDNLLFSTPAVADNRVYVASLFSLSEGEKVYCLDALNNGDIIWQTQENYEEVIALTIDNENIYFITPYAVHCLDADDGEEQWMQELDGYIYYDVFGSKGPAVFDNKIYIASTLGPSPDYYGILYCLDDSGIIWSSQQLDGSYFSPPTIADGKVYMGSEYLAGGYLHCFNVETGDLIWNYATSDEVWASPTIANGKLHVCTYDGTLYTFEKLSSSNNPPNAPSISGPLEGNTGQEYEYTFVAIDPDEDDVKYFIDWGDDNTNETDYFASGEEVTVNHTWVEDDTYEIKAKAIDIHGAEGPWGYLEVTMPVNYQGSQQGYQSSQSQNIPNGQQSQSQSTPLSISLLLGGLSNNNQ